ncbi:MAG: Hybrid peroxiredoxin hyPrx5 [Alphaproteobacteria bacterium MarineAlpha9_Bin3]|nr:MAG: Hybrid peroxiredoxin hyPrx5 [Alphaproteobacteria bacterium MarineAlpha9_Bin3]
MTISNGDKIPSAILKNLTPDGVVDINVEEYFADKKIVVFSVPGAFTPTCSAKHLPGFVEYSNDIISKGIDEIICISVNDPFVMNAWEKDQNSKGKVTLLADGNGELTEALGLSFDGTGFGLGKRGKRFAMIVLNGLITHLAVEEAGSFSVSSAESILKVLENN